MTVIKDELDAAPAPAPIQALPVGPAHEEPPVATPVAPVVTPAGAPLYLENAETLELFAYDPILSMRKDMRATDRTPHVETEVAETEVAETEVAETEVAETTKSVSKRK